MSCLACVVVLLSVLLLAGECSTKSTSDVVSPTFTRKMKDAIKFTGEAAKSAWKASTKTVPGVFTTDSDDTSSPLGPEAQAEPRAEEPVSIPELGECSASEEECGAGGSQHDEDLRNAEMDEEQRSQFDKDLSSADINENEDSEIDNDDGSDFELAIVDEQSESVLNQLYSTVSSGVSTVYKTAKENIYDKGEKLIRNFSEKVRHIIREELYSFLQTISSSLGDSLLTPGATLYYLGQTAMTITLIILCLFLSYMFFFRVSIFVILGGNASVYIFHQLLGPKWIFDTLYSFLSNFTWLLQLMYHHPYISAVFLMLLFLYFVIFPLVRWCTERDPQQRMVDLESVVSDISERMSRVEERQEEMLSILRRLDKQHDIL